MHFECADKVADSLWDTRLSDCENILRHAPIVRGCFNGPITEWAITGTGNKMKALENAATQGGLASAHDLLGAQFIAELLAVEIPLVSCQVCHQSMSKSIVVRVHI